MLVGSRAAKLWYPDFREPNGDWDFKARKAPSTFAGEVISDRVEQHWDESWPDSWDNLAAATPNMLYTIKVSHAFWDLPGNSWNKHMNDIIFFQRKGCTLMPVMYDILYKTWIAKHGAKRANLAMTSEDFFSDAVNRKYDHDSLHESCAYYDRPLYESILKDGEAVLTDKSKFYALPYDDQLKLIREEVYATALERWVIPSNYTCSPRAAYAKAIKKTIVSLTKGWFALWIVENYSNLYAPDVDYVQVHRDKADRLILL